MGLWRIPVNEHEIHVTDVYSAKLCVRGARACLMHCGSRMEVGEKVRCRRHGIQHVRIVQVELEVEGFSTEAISGLGRRSTVLVVCL